MKKQVHWTTLVIGCIIGSLVGHFMIVPYLKEQDWWPKKENNIEIKLPRVEIRSTK